ncbi:3'-5' exonuclease [Andrographis paniculata]|uniref:3'-5' exonuclease n=1 Tax=Andrographis paniculata TaxID=175694 RepID=UPI0021E880FF|nr:3'-5' exonuclease [Andrographis paniculata]
MGSQFNDSDADWDHLLTEEDLRAIDAAAGVPPHSMKHRARTDFDGDSASVDSPPIMRRRLPYSLFVFQQRLNNNNPSSSLAACNRNRFYTRNDTSSAFPDIKFCGHIIYKRTMEEMERAAMELLAFVETKKREDGQCVLGLDIEWRPTFKRGVAPGKAAVMQICGDSKCCFVFHIFHAQITRSLQYLLEDPTCQKVGVGIANDASKVFFDHNVSISNLEDLSDLACRKLGGEARKWSLSSLTEMIICRKLRKPNKIRLGNWEVASLSKEQLDYAATDAYVSWYLYQVLKTFPDPAETNIVFSRRYLLIKFSTIKYLSY